MNRHHRKQATKTFRGVPALTVLAALSASPIFAQTGSPPAATGDRTTITVTGSRASNRSAGETAVPVDIINQEMIEATGAVETGRLLQKLAPSFNFPQSFVSDGTDLIWPASLRGMGPDQVLVLVNGKRRHQQALVNVQQSIGRGSAGTDINTIPISSIERIEILRDGASAQYGSDAIAGVINIILKRQSEGGSVTAEWGKTYEGDGETFKLGANAGFKLGRGFVNLTGEYVDRGETNRAGPDSLRVTPPRVTQRIGDADMKSGMLWVNGGIPIGRAEFYFFGGASSREGNSSGFFRPSSDGRTIPALYPAGFLPTLLTTTDDYSLAVGLRGDINRTWTYDLSVNRGYNQFEFASSNSANVSWYFEPRPGGIFGETPTSANDGTLRFKQWTVNFDVKGAADWGIGREPIALAAGLEWREDGYQIVAGDPVSYTYGRTNNPAIFIPNQSGSAAAAGIQGFPGFSPATEVDGKRHSVGIYGDAEAALTQQLLLGAAVRFEDYSDAGTNTTGKVSMRFQATPQLALRGSASNGFRAPSVQQQFFSQISTTLGAQGVLTDTVTARQGSELTRLFGIQPLKQETSRTGAVGFVFQGRDGFNLTTDVYRIDVRDRIVFSSEIGPEAGSAGCTNPAICPVRVILGSLNLGAATFFTNAVDTKTVGADIVGQYTMRFGGGSKLQLDATYSYNKTTITRIRSQSSVIPIDVLFDETQRTLLEEGLPHHRGSLGGIYSVGAWRFGVNNTYYGEVSGQGFTGVKQTWGAKWLTDVMLNYRVNKSFDVTLGGNNVFDVYPDKWTDAAGFPLNALGFTYGWETLPFGLNGASYYVRAKWTF